MGTVYSYFLETSSENATTDNSTTGAPAPTQMTSENATTENSTTRTSAPAQPAVLSGHDSTYPPDTWRSYSHSSFEEEDVDKRNIIVKSDGKREQVDVFPDEKMNVLKQEACRLFQKKEQWMKMVYEGEELDVNKTIRESHLRAGSTVNLIRVA